jgi:hypothetical protein
VTVRAHDHSALIERMSAAALSDLLAPVRAPVVDAVPSVIELRRCRQCENYMGTFGRSIGRFERCPGCGAWQ